MKITKSWLLSQPNRFWSDLIFLLLHTSPYFGKLQWALKPSFLVSSCFNKLEEEDITPLKSAVNQITAEAQEEQVIKSLMTAIFWVTPDYNRTIFTHSPLPADDLERQAGMEFKPLYPGYHVLPAPNNNYRPIKDGEILTEDIKRFRTKLQVLEAPFSVRLLEEYRKSNKKIFLFKEKLSSWTKLLSKTNL